MSFLLDCLTDFKALEYNVDFFISVIQYHTSACLSIDTNAQRDEKSFLMIV